MAAPEVVLREVVPDDIELFFDHQADPEGQAMVGSEGRSREEHAEHWGQILADPTGVTRAIVHDGETVGHVVSFVQGDHREIGYWLAREHWGRGIASAAVERFLSLERERPLYGYVAEHNLGSIRVLEKCGFKRASDDTETAPGGTRYIVMELRS